MLLSDNGSTFLAAAMELTHLLSSDLSFREAGTRVLSKNLSPNVPRGVGNLGTTRRSHQVSP